MKIQSAYIRSIARDRSRRGSKPIQRLVLSMEHNRSKYESEDVKTMSQYTQELRDILGESDSDVDSICSSVDDIERESDNDTNANFVVDDTEQECDTEYIPSCSSSEEEETDNESMFDSDDEEIVSGIVHKINQQGEQGPSTPPSMYSGVTHLSSLTAPPLSPFRSHVLPCQMDDCAQVYHTP
jgi:hypothetical protein